LPFWALSAATTTGLAAQPATLLDASCFIGESSGFYKISRKNLAAAYRDTVGNTGELFKIG
jgi:hypothetical protein